MILGENKIPIFDATHSLRVYYRLQGDDKEDASIELNGAATHARIASGALAMLKTRSGLMNRSGNPVYKPEPAKSAKAFSKINFATAAVTLLYTDTSPDEGYLGEEVLTCEFDLGSQLLDRVVACQDYYSNRYQQSKVAGTKAVRCYDFNDHLRKRITNFSAISLSYDFVKEEDIEASIASQMFHEGFHHSEQAIMQMLCSNLGMSLLNQAIQSVEAAHLYGMVLDIYSQRTLCSNCNISLLGMQNSRKQGFIYDLSQSLAKPESRISSRGPGLLLQTRVSASRSHRNANMEVFQLRHDKEVVHSYDADTDCRVFQSDIRTLGLKKSDIVNDYRGALFSSTHIKSKGHWERAIRRQHNSIR